VRIAYYDCGGHADLGRSETAPPSCPAPGCEAGFDGVYEVP